MQDVAEGEWLTLWEAAGLLGMRSGYVRLLSIGRRIDFVRILTDERVTIRIRRGDLLAVIGAHTAPKVG